MKRLLHKIADWYHWPFGIFYLPLFPFWLAYCIRSRSLWFFSASNPSITFGGFEGESKTEIYSLLPADLVPKTLTVETSLSFEALISEVQIHGFSFPFIVKPDVGMEGLLCRKIYSFQQLRAYHRAMRITYLIQEFVEMSYEVSVFYFRFPDNNKGAISALLHKTILSVVGNGVSTLSELAMDRHHSAEFMHFLETQNRRWHEVIPAGESIIISHIGNRYYGSEFVDLSHSITPRLTAVFDEISHAAGNLYYGRYDIKCNSLEEMAEGRNFLILEFNGAGSIPNHVFTKNYTVFTAYKEIIRHWHILYKISSMNNRAGTKYWSFIRGYRYLRNAKQHFRRLRKMNKEMFASPGLLIQEPSSVG